MTIENSSSTRVTSLLDDRQFIIGCIVGDQMLRRRLAVACIPLVRKLVWLGYGDQPDTEATCERALVSVLRNLGRVAEPARFRISMYGVVCQEILRHATLGRRIRRFFFAQLEDTRHTGDSERDAALFGGLAGHLNRLPSRTRLAVTLSVFAGCSDSEIAEVLGCSRRRVEKMLASGMRRLFGSVQGDLSLRQRLEDEG